MGSPDRFQLDDHFAAAKARAAAPRPGTIGVAGALTGLVLLAGAVGAAWWWAVQPVAAARGDAHPLPVTVAERQAAVVDQLDADQRGPRLGGETSQQYEARLAAIRAHDARQGREDADAATGRGEADPAQAGSPAPAAGRSAATATGGRGAGAEQAAAPSAPAALGRADGTATLLASRVNERRRERATHLRWLDACAKQHLVELARAQVANARDAAAANAARLAANNLAADLANHQREAQRVDELLATSEQRLADYCDAHHQALPALENPATTVDGRLAQARPMPAPTAAAVPTIQPVGSASSRQPVLDPFAAVGR